MTRGSTDKMLFAEIVGANFQPWTDRRQTRNVPRKDSIQGVGYLCRGFKWTPCGDPQKDTPELTIR